MTLIPPHGGYRKLRSYQVAEAIYDATVCFCSRFVNPRSRTTDQMVQAARSGKQNIAEGSRASGTSRKTELKLVNVARASLEELLLDYEDFLRTHDLELWDKNDPRALEIRAMGKRGVDQSDRSDQSDRTDAEPSAYSLYRALVEKEEAETVANAIICLVHQANYLLDQQLRALEALFLTEGGFTERLYRSRSAARNT
jgi:restriction system protein